MTTSAMMTRSARTLQALRDPTDACQQRLEEVAVLAPCGAPALEQIHLHEIHGIDIRVAQLQRPLQGGIGIEQRLAALDLEDMLTGDGKLTLHGLEMTLQRLRRER